MTRLPVDSLDKEKPRPKPGLRLMILSASIIAPGREGSQLGGACPDMVEGCSHDPGLSDGLVMVRGGWVRRGTWSPRFSVGNRAPRRIRSQAIAQNHQGPQDVAKCGPWHYYHRGEPSAAVSWAVSSKNSDYRAQS